VGIYWEIVQYDDCDAMRGWYRECWRCNPKKAAGKRSKKAWEKSIKPQIEPRGGFQGVNKSKLLFYTSTGCHYVIECGFGSKI